GRLVRRLSDREVWFAAVREAVRKRRLRDCLREAARGAGEGMARGAAVVNSMRVIATGRLILEPQVAAHADEMFAVLSDPAIYEHENQPPPSIEWLRERFGRPQRPPSAHAPEPSPTRVTRLPP